MSYTLLYPVFDSIPVTTITSHTHFGALVNITNIFNLIPIGDQVGSALSIRMRDREPRGTASGGAFKNCVMIDIYHSPQTILKCKLYRQTIHCIGATSEDMCRLAFAQVIAMINHVQHHLELMQQHPEATTRAIELAKAYFKCLRLGYASYGRDALPLHEPCITDSSHQETPTSSSPVTSTHPLALSPSTTPTPAREDVTNTIFEYLRSLAMTYQGSYEDFVDDLAHIRLIDTVIDVTPVLEPPTFTMFNINYSLGFVVDLYQLARHINGRGGFFARYDNISDCSAKVELGYEKVANKVKKTTFTVHHGGVVTQSSPNREQSRHDFELFIAAIHELRPLITSSETHSVKIKKRMGPVMLLSPEYCRLLREEGLRFA
jgi:hypothetical protein